VVAERVLERAQDHALLGELWIQLDLEDRAGALHDPAGARAVGERAPHDGGHGIGLAAPVAGGLHDQCVEVEPLQARRPEPGSSPDGQLERLKGGERVGSQPLERPTVAVAGAGQAPGTAWPRDGDQP